MLAPKKNEVGNLRYCMYTGQVRDEWVPQTGKEFGAPDRLMNSLIFFGLERSGGDFWGNVSKLRVIFWEKLSSLEPYVC